MASTLFWQISPTSTVFTVNASICQRQYNTQTENVSCWGVVYGCFCLVTGFRNVSNLQQWRLNQTAPVRHSLMMSTTWSPWIIGLARTQKLGDIASDQTTSEEPIFGPDRCVWHDFSKTPQITAVTRQQPDLFKVCSLQPRSVGRHTELATSGSRTVDVYRDLGNCLDLQY